MAEADKVAKEEGDEYWEKFGKEIEKEKEAEDVEAAKKTELQEKISEEKPQPETILEKIEKPFSVSGVSLTDDQVSTGKTQPVNKSFRWLVEWFIFELLKAHVIINWVKGKFKRG